MLAKGLRKEKTDSLRIGEYIILLGISIATISNLYFKQIQDFIGVGNDEDSVYFIGQAVALWLYTSVLMLRNSRNSVLYTFFKPGNFSPFVDELLFTLITSLLVKEFFVGFGYSHTQFFVFIGLILFLIFELICYYKQK